MNPSNPHHRNERGSALVIALGMAVPLVIAGGTLLMAVTHERTVTEDALVITKTRDAADAGAHDAIAKLVANAAYTGTYSLAMGGPTASVTVSAWATNGSDDDGDGAVDEADEANFIGVTSSGASNVAYGQNGAISHTAARDATRTVHAVLQKNNLNIAVNQALYIDDPNASFKFSGTQFLISGNDTNINNSPGPNAAISGIGTPGDPAPIKAQIAKNQKSCIIGLGTNPSVGNTADVDLSTAMTSYGNMATTTWNGPNDTLSGCFIGNRTTLTPAIGHAKGNVSTTGGATGCGIMIIDGDLTVNGTFDYVGLFFVSGAVRFNGGGGNKDLHGAILTLGAVDGTDVTINGTVQLRYSSEAISLLNTKLSSGVSLVSWRER